MTRWPGERAFTPVFAGHAGHDASMQDSRGGMNYPSPTFLKALLIQEPWSS
jgi:hypothetical protein